MNITIAAIGRAAKKSPESQLIDLYVNRMPWPMAVREFEPKKPSRQTDERKNQEASLLLDSLPPGAKVIALDERGKHMGSEKLAAKVGQWRDEACRDLVLLIGGADGHPQQIRDRADLVLSFGELTWPHMMVRAMAAEQMYRCWSILNNHPYHRA